MNYYAVTAKCGHVGRNYYIPICFPVVAGSGKEAAAQVRCFPRVKHHHRDAILDVERIDPDEFFFLKEKNRTDPYLCCRNVQEQRQIDSLSARLCPEPADPLKKKKGSKEHR